MLYNTFLIVFIILLTTFTQKYYFIVLNGIGNIHRVLGGAFRFIIRFGVMVHEMCHMFFCLITGNKIKEVHFFEKNGGRVVVESKNYIGELPKYGLSLGYFSALVLNQIGLFLVSFGPLFFGITLSYAIFTSYGITDITSLLQADISVSLVTVVILYSVLIPSFALSIQDIEKFLISRQENLPATIIGSGINFLIFFSFVWSFSYFLVSYFIFFAALFLAMFFLQTILYILFLGVRKLLRLINRASGTTSCT